MHNASKRIIRLAPILIILLQLIVAGVGIYYVPIHWDEGWNLCAARVWLEQNHFGCLFMGELTTPRLSTGVLPTFLSKIGFELFGVSYLAARIPFLLHLLGFLTAFFVLVKKLFDRKTALLALALLTIYPDDRVNPALLATQANAEILMFLYLTIGYLLLFNLLKTEKALGCGIYGISAGLVFGIAAQVKYQARPFILLSLVALTLTLLLERRFKLSFFSAITPTIAFFNTKYSLTLLAPRQSNIVSSGSGTTGLSSLLGINLDWEVRLTVLQYLGTWYWYHLLAIFACSYWLLHKKAPFQASSTRPLIVAIFIFAASWTGWFLTLSIDFPRYFAPAATFGSIFSAFFIIYLVRKMTNGKTALSFIKQRKMLIQKALLLTLVTLLLIQTVDGLQYAFHFISKDSSYNHEITVIALEINSDASSNPIVETYESQIFHLLNVRYHYPPDQWNVQQIAKGVNREISEIYYDETNLNPDYIVIGKWSEKAFSLYQQIDNQPKYVLAKTSPHFKVFTNKTTDKNDTTAETSK